MYPEVKIKKILYATDLSDYARKTFAYAVSLAQHYDASITIIHAIIDSPDVYSSVLGYIDKEKWEAIKKEHFDEAREALIGKKRSGVPIRQVLDHFCEDAKEKFCDHPFKTDEIIVASGNPVEEILRHAEKCNCDIIVMGSKGHGSFVDAMIGSTSQRVLRRSKIPVLLVRLKEE
jgi:nucleotide-binding universal stress UspA family protein